MKINKINCFDEYKEVVDKFNSIKLYTNDYIQSDAENLILQNRLFVLQTQSNLFLFVKTFVGYRLYYYISNLDEYINFDNSENVVVEILYRGPRHYPQTELDYLCKCGFSINLVRDQYCGVYKDMTMPTLIQNVKIENAVSIEEINEACQLFNSTFDMMSGDFIPQEQYEKLLENKEILLAKSMSGVFLGALHQKIDKGVAWISHVAVIPQFRGMNVGKALVDAFVQNNYTTEKQRYMLWVQNRNIAAVKMYEKKGFKYINKSTISLIK